MPSVLHGKPRPASVVHQFWSAVPPPGSWMDEIGVDASRIDEIGMDEIGVDARSRSPNCTPALVSLALAAGSLKTSYSDRDCRGRPASPVPERKPGQPVQLSVHP